LRWAGLVVILAALVTLVVVLARPSVKQLLTPATCTVAAPSGTFTISGTQARYAATIAAVGERDGMPDHAVSIALATALQESKLTDLDYGDRDSRGLFQQRPSEGWGTTAQVEDPVYASNAFYAALANVPGWQDIAVTLAAQDVQHSADPDAYAQWTTEAEALAEAFTGEAPAALACSYTPPAPQTAVSTGAGTAEANAAAALPAGVPTGADAATTSDVDAAATTELGGPLPDQTVSSPTDGWRLASWLVARGEGFAIRAVSFDGWLWTAESARWTAAAVPSVDQVTYTTLKTTG
jgi:hypothetical protein